MKWIKIVIEILDCRSKSDWKLQVAFGLLTRLNKDLVVPYFPWIFFRWFIVSYRPTFYAYRTNLVKRNWTTNHSNNYQEQIRNNIKYIINNYFIQKTTVPWPHQYPRLGQEYDSLATLKSSYCALPWGETRSSLSTKSIW